ncbi:MAG TPA: hypothetical protein VHC00_07805 [Rhizobiaceae bacterium]|nr:hypothetical protein [Rhizobiaceae bacterium]
MRTIVKAVAASALLSFFVIPPALANSDDAKWIKQCVSDNSDQHQSDATIASYCSCMNNKMSESETRTITQWEKSHPKAEEACAREAGWVGK